MNANAIDPLIKAKLWESVEMNDLMDWLKEEYGMDDSEAKSVWSGFIRREYGEIQ